MSFLMIPSSCTHHSDEKNKKIRKCVCERERERDRERERVKREREREGERERERKIERRPCAD